MAELNETQISEHLGSFLFHMTGIKYQGHFHWSSELLCNKPLPEILATRYEFSAKDFPDPFNRRRSIERIIMSVENTTVSDQVFVHAPNYFLFEANDIFDFELRRNIGISIGCITAIALILFTDIQATLLIVVCIGCTLTDIVGFLHHWGITIDPQVSTAVTISIGFCVDYSIHIMHGYMAASGSRTERAKWAVWSVGPAVLNGGISTLMAVIVLAGSETMTFQVFFKTVSLTVLFGMFHGLLLLPVLLSVVGPRPRKDSKVHHDGGES